MEFRNITIEDKPEFDRILKQSDYQGCEYTFGNMFIWSNQYKTQFMVRNGLLLSASFHNHMTSAFPAGEGDYKEAIDFLLAYAKERGLPFMFHNITHETRPILEELYPGRFTYEERDGGADYIYEVEALSTLAGKKFHGKRNHIKRFKDNDWAYETITSGNLSEVCEMNDEWCRMNDCSHDKSLMDEQCAVRLAIKNFEALGFEGGLLRVDGRIVAFTLGEPLNSNTYVIHIEKAFSDIQGAYPAINQEFLLHNVQDFTYVNREEDLGSEGLRKAKMSYHPVSQVVRHYARYEG